jgi:L-cysteine/cystine lyase
VTLAEARALFPALEHVAYLNAGTFGPLAKPTTDVMIEQTRLNVEHGRVGKTFFEAMLAARENVRSLVATLLGTTADHIAVTGSTTDGCNIVLGGLGLRPSDEIVTTDAEHFGLAGPVFASGATIRVARVQELAADEALDAIVREITPRTRLIAVSHVLWTSGVTLDVHALKERARVPVLVDGAQSVGAIPVDVGGLDFYTVSGQKWLCGPEAIGALHVADVDALRVARPSYFAQESFEPGGEYVPREGAQRLDPGSVPVASLRGLATAIGLAPEWRFARIGEAAAHCRDSLADVVRVVTPSEQAGLVTFEVRDDPDDVVARLFDRGVVVRRLPGVPWVRASCGWWTSGDDIERLVAGVAGST